MKRTIRPLLVASAWLASACSDLTNVTAPGVVQPPAEENATGAVARYAGSVRLTTGALESGLLISALWTDELYNSDFAGNGPDTRYDARRPQTLSFQTGSIFTTYSNARLNVVRAIQALQLYAPTPAGRIGQLYVYQGYLELYLAEQFCNGIPFSTIDDAGNASYGAPVGTAGVYAMAMSHFDSALAISADSVRVMNAARVGKARALVGLARFSEAAALTAAVPTSFVFNLDFASTTTYGQYNYYWGYILSTTPGRGILPGGEGGNGIDWVGASDPRVPLVLKGLGSDGSTIVWKPTWITSYGSAQAIASGKEARLIEAEAALQANRNDAATAGTGWLGILNNLRATAITPAMPPLADPGNYDARVSLLFREKAFWTFITGLRMGDLRRLLRQYGRTQDKVYPTGIYKDGIPYGTDVVLEPPYSEFPNASFTACADKNP